MNPRLEAVWAKFHRGAKHYADWKRTLDAWLDGEAYQIRGQSDPASDWFVCRLVEVTPPPFLDLALIFADHLHNLRATLDHAIHQIVEIHGSTPTNNTGFPVVEKDRNWKSAVGSRLGGFPSQYLGIIKDAQPFNDPEPTRHWLYLLHHLDIREKHRLIVELRISDFSWEPTFECNRLRQQDDELEEQLPSTPAHLTDGTELVRVRARSRNGDLRITRLQKVENTRLGVGPVSDLTDFPGPLPFWEDEVSAIITALEPAFSPQQPGPKS